MARCPRYIMNVAAKSSMFSLLKYSYYTIQLADAAARSMRDDSY